MVSSRSTSIASSSSLRLWFRSALSVMYVPLKPETIIATPLVSMTLITDAGVVMPLSHDPMTTPRLVIAPSKAFMAK